MAPFRYIEKLEAPERDCDLHPGVRMRRTGLYYTCDICAESMRQGLAQAAAKREVLWADEAKASRLLPVPEPASASLARLAELEKRVAILEQIVNGQIQAKQKKTS